ncbi:bacteriohemerythrin [Thermodesulfobacteriota bacterium B35]
MMRNIDTVWKPEYSVGVEEIDAQHRYLFELWLMLDSIRDQEENRRSRRQVILSLLDYVDLHFSTEEGYYRDHPRYAEHRALHRAFVDRIRAFEQEMEEDRLNLQAMADFLRDWLIDHIVNTDIRYFNDMKEIRAGSRS